MVQASGTEGQSVAPTSLTVTAGLDGPSTTSAVLTVFSVITTTATVSTMSHASSRAVSVMISARPCGPIVTVVSTSDYIAGHPVKKIVNKSKVDQAVENKISTVASKSNRPTDQIQEKLKTKEQTKFMQN